MRHLFIINPKAGQKDSSLETIESIKQVLKPEEYDIHITTGSKDGYAYTKQYLEHHPQEDLRIYACGGDGTLNEVAQACAHHEHVSVGVYPIGSGNDFIKAFKDCDFMNLKALISAATESIDLFNLDLDQDMHYITINIANVGLDSHVVKNMARYKGKVSGKKAYQKAVIYSFFNHFGDYGHFSVDNRLIFDGDFVVCSIANGTTYGGGYKCAPKANCMDGAIEFCLIKKISHLAFLNAIKDYKKGLHIDSKKRIFKKNMIYLRGHSVEARFNEPLTICTDGELYESRYLKVTVDHQALNFIVPKKS